MANEVEEFNRYWSGCAGRYLLPKTLSPRLALFDNLENRTGHLAHNPENSVRLNVYTKGKSWSTRTETWADFRTRFVFYTPKSKFLNYGPFCTWYTRGLGREFTKGLTLRACTGRLKLTGHYFAGTDVWDTPLKMPSLQDYLSLYDSGYPTFHEVAVGIHNGTYLGQAFARYYALLNLPKLRVPALFYKDCQIGVYKRGENMFQIHKEFSDSAKLLFRLTGVHSEYFP